MRHTLPYRLTRVLRAAHCISACGWIGGGLAILILLKLAGAPSDQEEVATFQKSIIAIDDYLIIPSAGVAAVSGLLLCSGKNRAIGEHRWIKGKCIITGLLLVFGALWLEPELRSLLPADLGTSDAALFYRCWLRGSCAAILQTIGLLFLVALSIIKPEKPRNRIGTTIHR